MALLNVLTTLLNALYVQQDGPNAPAIGQAIRARVVPDPGRLSAQDLVAVPLDLPWFGKGVAFNDALLTNTANYGGLQNVNLLTVPPSAAQGVPGLIGKLTGQIDVPVQIPVYAIIRWSVKDKNGNLLVEGTDFIAPNGLTSPDVTIIFIPRIVKADAHSPVGGRDVFLCADVILGAGTIQTPQRTLPAVQFSVPDLGLPTILVAALDADFGGGLLVMVPAADWTDTTTTPLTTIVALVNALSAALSALSSIARFAAPLSGMQLLAELLTTRPDITFRVDDGIRYLNTVTITQNWLLQNDIEAEDTISSLLLVGVQNEGAECYIRDRHFNDEGSFTFRVGDKLFAAINNLHSKTPASRPDGNEITVIIAPRDWTAFGQIIKVMTFGNSLSSLRFL